MFEPEANFRLDDDAVFHDFRLNFAAIRLERIADGVDRLAAAIAAVR